MTDTPILSTKFLIPNLRSDMVDRPQLVERINQGLLHDFVLVSAPAGAGKTTLLIQWAQQSPLPVAWITLDARDNDPELLYHNLLLSMQTAFPGFSPIEQTLPQHQDVLESLRSGLVLLMNEVSRLNRDIALVLDDFHVITNPVIHECVGYLLESLPERLHIIISSRIDPQFSLTRLRAHDQMDEIRNNLLKFNADESREFFQKTIKIPLSAQAEEKVVHQTEGWVAGMQLAAISLQHQPDILNDAVYLTGDNSYIQDFLVDEVFSRQPEGMQNFLLRTSILGSLTGPLCDAVLNEAANASDSGSLLHELYHDNIFLTALDHEEHWFRYHPLFAESIQHLLTERLPDEISSLHVRASRWYESAGLIEEAVEHAFKAKDICMAAEIIERNIENTFKNGGIQFVLTWLKKIPAEILYQHPQLCIAYAWGSVFTFSVEEADYWVRIAEQSLSDRSGIPLAEIESTSLSKDKTLQNQLGEIYAVKSILATARLNSMEALDYSRRALDSLNTSDLFYRSFLAMEQSIYDLLDGNMIAAEQSLEATLRLSQPCGNWMVNMISRCHLGEVQASRGQLSRAVNTFKQSIPLTVDSEGKSMGFVGHLYVELGDVLLERNELAQAENYIKRGIELSQAWLPMLIELDARLHLIHLYAAKEDYTAARRELDAARKLTDSTSSTFDDIYISMYEARVRLQKGDLRFAIDWANSMNLMDDSLVQTLAHYPFSVSSSMVMIVSRIWLALSRQEKKLEYAQKAFDVVKALEVPLRQRDHFEMQLEVMLIEALALQELGKIDQALELLSAAYAMGEPEGYRRIFLDEGLPLARLTNRLVGYQKKHPHPYNLPTHEYLMEMIHLFSVGKTEFPADQQGETARDNLNFAPQVEMLTARESEVLQLVADGKTNAEIALHLCLSLNTVKRHMNSIFLKLGVTSRVQAVSVARKLKIVN